MRMLFTLPSFNGLYVPYMNLVH